MSVSDPEILEIFRGEAGERLDRMVTTLLALEAGGPTPDAVDSLFRDAHSIKGSAGMVGMAEVQAIAHTMEDSLEGPRDEGVFPLELTDTLLKATDELRHLVGLDNGGDAPEEPAAVPDAAPSPPAPSVAPQRTMRVGAERVDRLLDAVGETVLHSRRLEHLLGGDASSADDERIETELEDGEVLLDGLQNSVIQLRTLPLSSITGQFPRAVRDLAAANQKQVALVVTGAETQLDRVVLDGISDSITHLLRNSVAHGIETPDERVAAGKPACGRIELRAEQRAGMVAVVLSDDGRGVPAEMTERVTSAHTLADVLAEAGVSTATGVSDVAGRGVGLDAVRAHVQSLRGELEVETEPGRGTVTTMLLPLTLALLHVLLAERGGQTYGVPLASVEEVVDATTTLSLGGHEAIEVRGRSVPLADLAQIVGAFAPALGDAASALIVSSSRRRVAVVCDRVVGEREVVVKTLGPLLTSVPGYLGAAIGEDGAVGLILDPTFLTLPPTRGRVPGPATEAARPPTVLVVDDQFTVRELQRSILETAGYRVIVACDGLEALEAMNGADSVDVVVTDVDMPGMGGIELLRAIRDDPDRSSLPVVVVSGRGGDEDRKLGLEAGADAYIVKEEFDQRTLLGTLGRLVPR
jgi:two-component system, chemotaxis family, sensor kinase CheA